MSDADLEVEFREIVAAVGRADRPRAIVLATAALDHGIGHPLVLLLAAEGFEAEGRFAEALDLLDEAVEVAPDAAEAWRRYGALLARQNRLPEGLAALEKALALEPDVYAARLDAGATCFKLADLDGATRHYRRASELAPEQAEPLAALAAIAARREDYDFAREAAKAALDRDGAALSAHMALARSDLRAGDAMAAAARMGELLTRADLPDDARVGALDLRAEAFDALSRTAEAFADYEARNAILTRLHGPRIAAELDERRPDRARRLAAFLARAPEGGWASSAGPDLAGRAMAGGHVFLLGFPRSGTTLLEKALAGHPRIVTLEEIDHLETVAGSQLADDAALARLTGLSPADAAPLREAYWRGVAAGTDIVGRMVVDKLPLHTANLPLIAKLFPDARILFALRDPRDVVFSCFRRRFQMNAAMFEFLTLKGAAAYYDAVMALGEACRSRMPLKVREVRHESLVADFDGEMRAILAFLGLDWDEGVRGFAGRAKAALRTPSDPQVARGLNSEGLGQWRRYSAELRPILGDLDPWVRRFDYPAD